MAKLPEKSGAVYEYVVNNGGRVSIDELAEALGVGTRSVGGSVTSLTKKGLVLRDKVKGDDDKDITYVCLTDDHATVYGALEDKE